MFSSDTVRFGTARPVDIIVNMAREFASGHVSFEDPPLLVTVAGSEQVLDVTTLSPTLS
jgi:hypothetical protein